MTEAEIREVYDAYKTAEKEWKKAKEYLVENDLANEYFQEITKMDRKFNPELAQQVLDPEEYRRLCKFAMEEVYPLNKLDAFEKLFDVDLTQCFEYTMRKEIRAK